ncbi:uncharacterized protein N7496_010456 [Penicillium cataractarum]|uniref:Uncharacterized protein n=1 Tax=Penicillium cataractarum TaxID=2100454 RepID=A0A9W9RQU9_9EURO|nr:uncharacterized protein N7496_010456 [Penicillium cataractarum]KAJ5364743.1 hypothetical protein N7496_010456 [Penicillium cataractarum]
MNISGPKLVKNMTKWLSTRDSIPLDLPGGPLPVTASTGYPATLVILHDELEAPLGKVRVKRGGPESASLRGHRGLISVLETLRGKGLFPAKGKMGSAPVLGKKRGKGGGGVAEGFGCFEGGHWDWEAGGQGEGCRCGLRVDGDGGEGVGGCFEGGGECGGCFGGGDVSGCVVREGDLSLQDLEHVYMGGCAVMIVLYDLYREGYSPCTMDDMSPV